MAAVLPCLCDGGIFGTFIDWRGLPTVNCAAAKIGLVPQNLIVWAKTNAGMGSLYRSQHELLPLFKNGSAPHVNNVELGKRGRWRSNVWTYPGAFRTRPRRVRVSALSQAYEVGLGDAGKQLSLGVRPRRSRVEMNALNWRDKFAADTRRHLPPGSPARSRPMNMLPEMLAA
jgi:hypothetical protein